MTFTILLTIIYSTTLLFWTRYLYNCSLKKTVDRTDFFNSIKKIFLFIPLGIQSILLFCFALTELIPLSNKLAAFIELNIYGSRGFLPVDFEALRIVFSGCLLVALQYLLLKMKPVELKSENRISRFFVLMISIYFLETLIANIRHALFFEPLPGFAFEYDSFYLWLLYVIAAFAFAFMKAEWIYKKQMNGVKYLSLASRMVFGYLLLVFIIGIPRIIYTVIQHL